MFGKKKYEELLNRLKKLETQNKWLTDTINHICDLGEKTAEMVEYDCERFAKIEKDVNDLIIHKYMIMNSDHEYFFRSYEGQLLLTLFESESDFIKDIVIIPDIKEGYCIRYKWFNEMLFIKSLVIEEVENPETITENYCVINFANNIPDAWYKKIDEMAYMYMIPDYINEAPLNPKMLLDVYYDETPFIEYLNKDNE